MKDKKIYLIGEKDHYKKNKTDMKQLFIKEKITPDIIFTEGNGKPPVLREYNPFKEYLITRKKLELPEYEYIENAINKNYNTERNLEGNLIVVEDLKLFNFQISVFAACINYLSKTYSEFEEINKIDNIFNEFNLMRDITNKIMGYNYTNNEKEISNIEKGILTLILKELDENKLKNNYSEEAHPAIYNKIRTNSYKILYNLRNEIFYENIINNIKDEKNIVLFLGDAHMPYFNNKFPINTYIKV